MNEEKTVVTAKYRRLCIYFFYDPDGIVDEYVLDCLNDVSKNVEKILFVSNSKLQPQAKKALAAIGSLTVLTRPNTGFDVWAYKHGIDTLGWAKITSYDEVIFMNFTIVGPLYPFKEMFDKMAARKLDFWGINIHSGEPYDPWGMMPDGVIPKHLQSHFIVVRRPMLKSKHFQDYWNNMRPIRSYQEAISYHEAIFTQTFQKHGFKWDSYVDTRDLESLTSYPLMFMPKEVIKNRRCPVFKRKALILPMDDYSGYSMGLTVVETIECVEELGYDISKILPNVLRTGNQHDIRMALNAVSILPETATQSSDASGRSSAVLIYIDNLKKYDLLEEYLKNIIINNDVHVTVTAASKAKVARRLAKFKTVKVSQGDYIDFLKNVEKASRNYSFLGIIGFCNQPRGQNGLSEKEVYTYGLKALFADEAVINSALTELAVKELYGVLAAPQTLHANFANPETRWKSYFTRTRAFLTAMDNEVDVRPQKLPLTSSSGMHWIKSSALDSMMWQRAYKFFQRMPDVHAQRIFNFALPFIVQKSGSLMAYAMPKPLAENYITMLTFKNSRLSKGSPADPQTPSHPSNLYLMKNGKFSEKEKIEKNIRETRNGFKVSFTIPYDTKRVRFDPVVETVGVVGEKARATVNGSRRTINAVNALSYNKIDIFLTNDPQYDIKGSMKKGDRLVITFTDLKYYSESDFSPTRSEADFGGELRRAVIDMQQHYQGKRPSRRKRLWQRRFW